MEPLTSEIFATKGAEYLLVIGFLPLLAWFWWYLIRSPGAAGRTAGQGTAGRWFRFPAEAYFHPGHSWARPEPQGLVRVGIDDFAQKLIGVPEAVHLPAPGARVEQGARDASFRFGDQTIDLLSPVDGQVVARNEALDETPELINRDPYGAGWLLLVAPTRIASNLGNLLHRGSAAAWMSAAEESLRARMAPGLGVVLQDGGVPVTGIARNVFGEGWEGTARELLLTP